MIYFDNDATTRVCPEAARAALDAMTDGFCNPSSGYPAGKEAAGALKAHRETVAAALGCAPEELCFTSCGTEGDNWAIRAAVDRGRRRGKHLVTTAIEHAAVLEPMKALARQGYEVTWLKPDRSGHVSLEDLRAALRKDTVLVSMMLVNNELGTVQPVAEAVKLVKDYNPEILFHTDAVQAFLKVPFSARDLGVDLLTVSGHKVRAPKGIGAQVIRRGLNPLPLLLGGGQESGLRPGTEATAQTAAFAAAVAAWNPSYPEGIRAIKNYALESLSALPGLEIVTPGDAPHILSVSLPDFSGASVVEALGGLGICVSSGSACHRGKPSHVFAALPLPPKVRLGALRISFGPESTREEVDALSAALEHICRKKSLLF